MSFMILIADCPPDYEDWDCYEDARAFHWCNGNYFPDCVVEFDYCIRVGWDGQNFYQDVYLGSWEIKNGNCNCIDPEKLCLLYIYNVHPLVVSFPGTDNFVIHTQPCWSITGQVHNPCSSEACCKSEYNVSYNQYYDNESQSFIRVVTDVEFVDYNDPLVNCEGINCVANCTSWVIPDYDWDDYLPSSLESIGYGYELDPPKNINFENNYQEIVNHIIVFPNPSSGIISINLGNINEKIKDIIISNTEGRIVYRINNDKINNPTIEVDIRDLVSGNYNITINSYKSEIINKKLIINK
jgi:hypothetical protein